MSAPTPSARARQSLSTPDVKPDNEQNQEYLQANGDRAERRTQRMHAQIIPKQSRVEEFPRIDSFGDRLGHWAIIRAVTLASDFRGVKIRPAGGAETASAKPSAKLESSADPASKFPFGSLCGIADLFNRSVEKFVEKPFANGVTARTREVDAVCTIVVHVSPSPSHRIIFRAAECVPGRQTRSATPSEKIAEPVLIPLRRRALEMNLNRLVIRLRVVILAEGFPVRRNDLNQNFTLRNFRRVGNAFLIGLQVQLDLFLLPVLAHRHILQVNARFGHGLLLVAAGHFDAQAGRLWPAVPCLIACLRSASVTHDARSTATIRTATASAASHRVASGHGTNSVRSVRTRGDLLLQCPGLQIDSVSILSYFRAAVDATAANGSPLHTPAGEFVQPARHAAVPAPHPAAEYRTFFGIFWGAVPGGKSMGFATDAIHVGQEPDPTTGAIVAPIYQTSTYVQEALGKNKGYDYARTSHPNRRALERCVAKLEGGEPAYVFTSGMAAIDALFRLLRPGDHTIVSEAVYGGVYRLTTQLLVQFGLEFSFVDTSNAESVRRALRPNTKMLYVETPTNPTMIVTDIAEMAAIANEHNLDAGRGQHFPQSLPATAHQARRAHRRALDDQISERPQRCPGRRRHPDAPRGRRENLLPAALDGSGPGAHGLLSGFARDQDAGRAHGAARRQRHGHRAFPRGPSEGQARALSRPAVASRNTKSRGSSSAASAR